MSDLSDTIDNFNQAQINKFNQDCDNKIYEDSNLMMTPSEETEAENAASEVNEMTSTEVGELQAELSRKLSSRPC